MHGTTMPRGPASWDGSRIRVPSILLPLVIACGSPGPWQRDDRIDAGPAGRGDLGRDPGDRGEPDATASEEAFDALEELTGREDSGDLDPLPRDPPFRDPADSDHTDAVSEDSANPIDLDAGSTSPTSGPTREEVRDAVLRCSSSEEFLRFLRERYDGPVCDDEGCTLIVNPGSRAVSLRGEFNAWGETPMDPVPCHPGAFWAEVPPVPGDRDAWQYRIFTDGTWKDDDLNRWIRFTDISINNAMHRPGTHRIARIRGIASADLPEPREVYVYVPAQAFEHPDRRFPVLILQDGWNVFDNPRAPFGSWNVERSAQELADLGAIEPVIVVGVTTSNRVEEYLYTDFWVTGQGTPFLVRPRLPAYADLIVNVVLPRIRSEFPARSGPTATAIGGSSLGGLSAFWIAWMYADVFGKVAALSPSFWVGEVGSGTEEKPSMREIMNQAPPTEAQRSLRIYLDSGDGGYSPGGGDDPPYAWDGRAYTEWMRNHLIRLGWSNRPEWDTDGDLATPPDDFPLEVDPRIVPHLAWSPTVPPGYLDWNDYLRPDRNLLCLLGVGHLHNEVAWAARFPAVLRFLFPSR